MKAFLAVIAVIAFPVLISAQQKSPQQDLQNQINELREETQAKISSLQDTIEMLRNQIPFDDHFKAGRDFYSVPPMPDEAQREMFDALLRKHQFKGAWDFKVPDPPASPAPLNLYPVPPVPDNNFFYWKQFDAPSPDELHRENHKHEWMKMLPFGNFFI